jgi:hypothetical protein
LKGQGVIAACLIGDPNMSNENMTFEQHLAKAAEEANENELVTMTQLEAWNFIDSCTNEDLANAMDHAQGGVKQGNTTAAYILLKIVP